MGVCAHVNMWHCSDLREKGGVLTDMLKMCFTAESGRGRARVPERKKVVKLFTNHALEIIRPY